MLLIRSTVCGFRTTARTRLDQAMHCLIKTDEETKKMHVNNHFVWPCAVWFKLFYDQILNNLAHQNNIIIDKKTAKCTN
jgi:hypothetical protein